MGRQLTFDESGQPTSSSELLVDAANPAYAPRPTCEAVHGKAPGHRRPRGERIGGRRRVRGPAESESPSSALGVGHDHDAARAQRRRRVWVRSRPITSAARRWFGRQDRARSSDRARGVRGLLPRPSRTSPTDKEGVWRRVAVRRRAGEEAANPRCRPGDAHFRAYCRILSRVAALRIFHTQEPAIPR
jgi:hypothetical protein